MNRTIIRNVAITIVITTLFLSPLHAEKAKLSRQERQIVSWVDQHIEEAYSLLGQLVDTPSATMNVDGVRENGALLDEQFTALGFTTKWIEMPPELKRAGHLVAERKGKRGKRVLLIGHLDTVLEGSPWKREGSVGHGIGGSDMKGGDVILLYALAALQKSGALDGTQIVAFFTGDEEEAGRPFSISRKDLVDAAMRSDIALAFEGDVPKTGTVARRGISTWKLTTHGRTGHSSRIFSETSGNGAIFEAARILEAFRLELSHEEYLTFNPSVIVGGTDVKYDAGAERGSAEGKTNVIPQRVEVEGDLRFVSTEQREMTRARMREIVARHLPGSTAEIEFEDGYPSMAPNPRNYDLLKVLSRVSEDLGQGPLEPLDPAMRGAGDVAFVADHVACIDGLGANGDREHSLEEKVDLSTFPDLIKRAAILIYRLTR